MFSWTEIMASTWTVKNFLLFGLDKFCLCLASLNGCIVLKLEARGLIDCPQKALHCFHA